MGCGASKGTADVHRGGFRNAADKKVNHTRSQHIETRIDQNKVSHSHDNKQQQAPTCISRSGEASTSLTEVPSVTTAASSSDSQHTEAPHTEAPHTEAPHTEASRTEAPHTEAPHTEATHTEAPHTEAPHTEASRTEAPHTEAPHTEAPHTEAPHTQSTDGGTGEATHTRIPDTVQDTTPQSNSLLKPDPNMQCDDIGPEIPAYTEEALQLAQQLVHKNPELASGFSEINAFVKVLEDEPNLEDTLGHVSELLKKVVGRSYVNKSDKFRSIFADYMSHIRISEAVCKTYTHVLQQRGLEFLTEKIAHEHFSGGELLFVKNLRTMLWNYTDASLAFSERVCSSGILKHFVGDLKLILEEAGDSSKVSTSDKFFRSARGILHNCSMNPITLQTIRQLGTVTVTLAYLKGDEPVIKMTILLILANIIDEEDNKYLLAEDLIFNLMLKIIQKAMSRSRHRYDGFSVSELLVGLTGLAKNDQNKKVLTAKGATPVLLNIMTEGTDKEQEKATLCIWELAFDKDNQKSFLENVELMLALKNLTGSTDKNISKAAVGALWVIQQEENKEKEERHTPDQLAVRAARGHVMISYQWADQKVVIKVKEHLRHQGYTVWMDIDNMEGSTLQAMAEAVQNSAVVLVCMTERYKLSQNCRSEAEYAFDLRKEIVPLIMQRGYKPDGWLGMIKGAKLFFDFSGKYPFEQKAAELTKELGERGKGSAEDIIDGQVAAVVQSVPSDVGRGPTSVEGWSNNDVDNWLSKIGLEKRKTLNTLTGKQLAFLHKLSFKAPEFFYSYAKTDLQLCNLEDLMNFTEAVDLLR